MGLQVAPKGWEEKFPRRWAIAGVVVLVMSLAFFLVWLRTEADWASALSGLLLVLAVVCFIRAFLYRVLARRPGR